jgi:large subunit ribosomal protein L32
MNRGCPAAYFLLAIKQASKPETGLFRKSPVSSRIELKGRSIMGALPKRKISKSRRDRRRSHHALKTFHLVPCPECGSMKRAHHVCLDCGKYRGRQIVPPLES